MGPFSTHRLLARVALSAAQIFGWLFAFQYYYTFSGSLLSSLVSVTGLFALSQIVAILVTPYAARRLRRGIRGMLVNALLALSAAYAILACAFSGALGSIPLGIVCFALLMGLYRALYWIPYEFAARKRRRDRVLEFMLAFIPALAGYAISLSPTAPLYVLAGASALALLAIVPLYAMRNTQEGFSWGYRQTFRHLFQRNHRKPLVLALCNGFEGAALLLLWPVAMLVLLHWSYATLGIVITLTYLCTALVRYVMKPLHKQTATPFMLSLLTFSGWMFRGTVAAPFSIVLVDSYYHVGSGITERGVDMLVSEQAADSNSYLDEFTALKDMGQGIGRVMFCIALLTLAPFFAFSGLALVMFFIAAVVGVASILLGRRVRKEAF